MPAVSAPEISPTPFSLMYSKYSSVSSSVSEITFPSFVTVLVVILLLVGKIVGVFEFEEFFENLICEIQNHDLTDFGRVLYLGFWKKKL